MNAANSTQPLTERVPWAARMMLNVRMQTIAAIAWAVIWGQMGQRGSGGRPPDDGTVVA